MLPVTYITVIDEHSGTVGRIAGVEDSTLNTLLIVSTETDEILIPAVGEMITFIDEDKKNCMLRFPTDCWSFNSGLLLNSIINSSRLLDFICMRA